jgi:hypothetical protein
LLDSSYYTSDEVVGVLVAFSCTTPEDVFKFGRNGKCSYTSDIQNIAKQYLTKDKLLVYVMPEKKIIFSLKTKTCYFIEQVL